MSRQVPVSFQRVERQLSCLLLSQTCACLLLCVSYDGQYARYCSIPHMIYKSVKRHPAMGALDGQGHSMPYAVGGARRGQFRGRFPENFKGCIGYTHE